MLPHSSVVSQIAQHIARRGAASNGRAYVSLDKALAKIAGAEIMVGCHEKTNASQVYQCGYGVRRSVSTGSGVRGCHRIVILAPFHYNPAGGVRIDLWPRL